MRFTAVAMACVLVVAAAFDADGSGTVFNSRPDAVYSPHGSVPEGSRAFAQDRYAMEISPTGQGNIGVYDRESDELLVQIDALPGRHTNNLKGLAFSPDGAYLAVMYHGFHPGTPRRGVTIYDSATGEMVKRINIGTPFHYMAFSHAGDELLLSSNPRTVEQRHEVDLDG